MRECKKNCVFNINNECKLDCYTSIKNNGISDAIDVVSQITFDWKNDELNEISQIIRDEIVSVLKDSLAMTSNTEADNV